ncbi:MAG TPA: hypothetical protein VFI48_05810 [Hyphomicrobiaceae bacterium]|nr:hypothetical protein [Hyphomicrobiaceae bacterium]
MTSRPGGLNVRARGALLGTAAGLVALILTPLAAQQPSSSMLTLESPAPHRYTVNVPSGCRQEEGPGTIDAICSVEFDADKSAEASAAASLVFEVGAETVAGDAGKAVPALAAGYGEEAFKGELPEAVCGEADRTRVKIENVKQVLEEGRVAYTAEVLCSEVKFLGLGERRAAVKFLVTPGVRYRLLARAPQGEYEQHRQLIEAFLASFRVLPAG